MKYFLVCFGYLFISEASGQQKRDHLSLSDYTGSSHIHSRFVHLQSYKAPAIVNAFKIPLLLTGASLYAMTDNENLSKKEFKEERDEWTPNFHHNADDYLQYAPIAAVYGLNLAGIKGCNNFRDRSIVLLKAELLVAGLTYTIKRVSHVARPDTGERNSFPSGHTAQAFAAATFMAREYRDVSVWYGVSAYAMATTVGAMRILNNRHWVSDVLAGAGIGILSTNLAYLTQRKTPHRKELPLIIPSYDGTIASLSIVKVLN